MTTRVVALLALAAAVVTVVLVLTGGSSYTIHARFVDAGQTVKGGLVEVGGREVGTIGAVTLAPDGQADLRLDISDKAWQPLHRGTIATVRTVGLSGVANRFIELTPGPAGAPAIPDGGVLSSADTRPIIDLDTFFDSLDPRTRRRIQGIIKNGSQVFAGSAADANTSFRYLAPLLAQSDALTAELSHDRVAVARLLRTGAVTASALADRAPDVTRGISATATTMRAIARERGALDGVLRKAPPLLDRAGGLLGGVRGTVDALRPALREARPVAPALARLLRRLVPVSRAARPVLERTTALLPTVRRTLDGAPALARVAVPALTSTATSLIAVRPALDDLLPYIPDLVGGFINGFGGKQTGYYDANGDYGRISVQGGTGTLTSALSAGILGGGAGLKGYRTGLVARCPGGATEPAGDHSNPFIPNPSTCNPADDAK